ncbi:hypothetical protein K469DRAFT_688399 [Zopfia rhizophila CBS 207.26]|uniref:Inhibitor of apoptosis repeat-containing protein n=1 Tax=Zopfia rhizophila CBS 207.26 TaxID=1314779 RepID=A0A6A6E238_9PEZI|nr:hypothetical protein K469DRAFT_688399 [Zopfia rhizophila CBS 207.26]
MSPQENTEKNQLTEPFRFDLSVLSSLPKPCIPDPPRLIPPTRRRANINKLICISDTFSTISSRELSFQEWPYTSPTPRQLARAGLYYDPTPNERDKVKCFTCGAEFANWDPNSTLTDKELLEDHEGNCLWADMRRDVEQIARNPENATRQDTPARHKNPIPSPPVSLNTEELATSHHSTLNEPTPTEIQNPKSQPQHRTKQPRHPQARPPHSPSTSKPTYASVLATPSPQPPKAPRLSSHPPSRCSSSRSSHPPSHPLSHPPFHPPQSTSLTDPTTASPYHSSPNPTLSIQDLHNRFYNRPSPLERSQSTPRDDHTQDNLVIRATDSLSQFLLSALPAFTRFLLTIQEGQHNGHVPYKGYVGRYNSSLGFALNA